MKSFKRIVVSGFSFFKKLSIKKKVALICGILITVAIVVKGFSNGKDNGYNTEPVQRADIVEKVDESGAIKISAQTDIYSPTNGIIEELYVSNNDPVAADQELFKVRSTATQQEQQAAYANYLTALNALNAAKSNQNILQADMFAKWDTFKELAESDDYEDSDGHPKYENRSVPEFHIPEKQWLAAEQKFIDQQQVIAQAQAAVSSAWLQYQATQTTVVKSPTSGVVSNLSVIMNDSVTTPTNTLAAASRPILTVADYSVIGVLLSLGESDINKVHSGDQAEIDVDPVDNKTYKGVVTRVDEIGYAVAGLMKYDVFIEIQDRDDQLKSGMSADAVIVTKKREHVLSVPNTAVKPYQGGKAVQIVNTENTLEFVPVQIGVRGEQRTEIVKGLSEGQKIVTALKNEQVKKSGLLGF